MNNKKLLFLVFISILSISISFSFVSARHAWWHFWGEELQYAPVSGTLSITSDPGKAGVYIDNKTVYDVIIYEYRGNTGDNTAEPLVVSLPQGYYSLKIIKSGYKDYYADFVYVESSKTTNHHTVLVSLNTCIDSDNGNNPNTFGIVNTTNQTVKSTFNDACISTSSLSENFCNTDGTRGYQIVNCLNGCANGVCKPDSGLPDSCKDSDRGEDPNVFGIVNVTNKTGVFSYTDYCNVNGMLNEYICNADKTDRLIELTSCKVGCEDGKCKTPLNITNQTCTDSDGGNNYSAKGIVNITNKTGIFQFMDVCRDNTVLSETSCRENNLLAITDISCGVGRCVEGACVSPRCGNGVVELGEECDDGNNVTGDGCSEICLKGDALSSCKDSDGGKNHEVKGELNFTNRTLLGFYGDRCLDSNILLEQYCDVNQRFEESYNCPNGCENGICKSAPVKCTLTSASWSVTEAKVGDAVELTVTGNNCDKEEVRFSVLEVDSFSGDDPVNINPQNTIFRNNIAHSNWTVEDQFDEFFTKPEYFFIARLESNPEELVSSKQTALLKVV